MEVTVVFAGKKMTLKNAAAKAIIAAFVKAFPKEHRPLARALLLSGIPPEKLDEHLSKLLGK